MCRDPGLCHMLIFTTTSLNISLKYRERNWTVSHNWAIANSF